MRYEGESVTAGTYSKTKTARRSVSHSPCSAGRRSHSEVVCSRTAAAPRAPASRPRAGPAAGRRRLPTGGSASEGRNLWAGSSGTLTTRRGIATSSSANRAERTSSKTRRETASSADGLSAPAAWRGLNLAHWRSIPGPLISGVMGGIKLYEPADGLAMITGVGLPKIHSKWGRWWI